MNDLCMIKTRRIVGTTMKFALLSFVFCNNDHVTEAESVAHAHTHTRTHAAPRLARKATHILADDTKKDSTFEEFCSNLLTAAKTQDKQFVCESISPEISMHIGGARGKKAFLEEWQNLAPESEFWLFLKKSISHGAQYDSESEEFHAPAISFEDSHSELPQCIGWNETSILRTRPEQNAPPIKTVLDEQLTMLEPHEPEPVTAKWLKVKCKDGTVGYIDNANVYGAYDEFVVFAKRNHRWCITWFGYAGL